MARQHGESVDVERDVPRSCWSPECPHDGPGHATFLRRRREWFQKPPGLINVLWWLPAGEIPTLDDAVRPLRHLQELGSSSEGWGFAAPLDPPSV